MKHFTVLFAFILLQSGLNGIGFSQTIINIHPLDAKNDGQVPTMFAETPNIDFQHLTHHSRTDVEHEQKVWFHDLESIDGIINALYDVLSGGVDEVRDWDRFRNLFLDGARLIPTGISSGEHISRILDPEQYIEHNAEMIERIGFVEREIGRRTEEWGNIAQVFSAYEAFRNEETDPFMRGINSFQLWNDGSRWWIVTIMWEAEQPDNQLPPELQ